MQPLTAAMIKVRQAFYAAIIRSLLRTKSLLQTILNLWIPPAVIRSEVEQVEERGNLGKRTEFLQDVEQKFRRGVGLERLLAFSRAMKCQFEASLLDNPMCMLPSYNHQLPTGEECGTFLALDVGGSTFRVALIQLYGKDAVGQECSILKSKSFKIGRMVKQLKGALFFDWMAEKIEETLADQREDLEMTKGPLCMGLAWSFPIEQTSLRSGLLLGMGKGFLAASGLLGKDLGVLIEDSCLRKGLNVRVNAIVNDSSATLLSKAYLDQNTRFALILGTGVNAAVHLPVSIFSPAKFGVRPSSWHESAKHVIVNTELSMFGKGILPYTSWDHQVLATHPMPDFQPLEHFVSGGYLGEIARLVLIEGIQSAGLFGGIVPPSLKETYTLETETISRIESDLSPTLHNAQHVFASRHPSTHIPTLSDMQALRLIASSVTQRAAGVLAASVHGLWEMRNEAECISACDSKGSISYNGSVLELYPNFKTACQAQLDDLVAASGGDAGAVELLYAEESSLIGAAVAVACANS